MTIAFKEARESRYWIRLLTDTNYLKKEESESLLKDIEEIMKIITSTQKNNEKESIVNIALTK
jgi:four helix bundle protein